MHHKNINIEIKYPKEIPKLLANKNPMIGPKAAPKSCHVEYLETILDF